jgi:Fe-S oxidoreductase/nitrate reductase gamma subunit
MLLAVTRETLIQEFYPYSMHVMYVAFFVSGFVMLFGFYLRLRAYNISPIELTRLVITDVNKKIRRFIVYALGHRKIVQDKGGGIMHSFVFYGFLMLFIYTSLIFIQTDILPLFTSYTFIQGNFYLTLEFLGDTFGIAYVVGLLIAVYRRYVKRLEKLESMVEDKFVLGMLIWIGISGFILEAIRISMVQQSYNSISYVGYLISSAVGGLSNIEAYGYLWFAHMFSVMILIAATPFTKLSHVILSSLNIAVAPVKKMGKMDTPFSLREIVEKGELNFPEPVMKASDLKPLQVFMADACTNCGRCQEVCPAYASGRELSPRLLVRDIAKDALNNETKNVFESGAITENELWSCTMCYACVSVCPVMIDQVQYVTEFRRTLVSTGRLDQNKANFLENIARTNNPYGLPQSERQSWIRELGVKTFSEKKDAEYLYWIGCQSSYDSRGSRIAKAMVRIMKSCGVDFAVLGSEEFCTGEPVRRMGEEGRFQELVLKNIETISRYKIRKIIVHCPHCFNTLKNEYPEFGLNAEIIHHTQFIFKLINEGKLKLKKSVESITYHDPCNLGRINGIFEEPREALKSLGVDLKEMKRSRTSSFCCGGGGANVWYSVPEKRKISVIRSEEAIQTGAKKLAVACPFCIVMFEDAMNSLGDSSIPTKDIAEIIEENMVQSN